MKRFLAFILVIALFCAGCSNDVSMRTLPYNMLGLSLTGFKQYDLALFILDKSLEIDPDSAETYLLRGDVYKGMKDYDKAIKEYDKAIEIDPCYDRAYCYRARVYKKTKVNELAIADYTQAIRTNPLNARYYYERARFFFDNEEYEASVDDCTKGLIVEPDDVYILIRRGKSYFRLKKYELAFEDLLKAAQIKPVYNKIYCDYKADYHIERKEYDLAVENYNKIIVIDEDWSALIYKKRGMCYELQGLNYLALEDYKTFILKAEEKGYKEDNKNVQDAKKRIEELSGKVKEDDRR